MPALLTTPIVLLVLTADTSKLERYLDGGQQQFEPSHSQGEQHDIISYIQAEVPTIKACVAEQKKRDPKLSGRLVMRWTIETSGKVRDVSCTTEKFKGTYIASCLAEMIQKLQFPKHRKQGPPIDFPFTF